MDNLHRCMRIIVNACPITPICLADEDTADDPFISCRMAESLSRIVISWFGCNWASPPGLLAHFEAWRKAVGSVEGKLKWRLSFVLS